MAMDNSRKLRGGKIRRNENSKEVETKLRKKPIFEGVIVGEKNENDVIVKIGPKKVGGRKISGNQHLDRESINRNVEFEKGEEDIKEERIKTRKLHILDSNDNEEQELDREIEQEDNFSIVLMILILVVCFVVGITLGYILYRIAINSSNVMLIVKYLFR